MPRPIPVHAKGEATETPAVTGPEQVRLVPFMISKKDPGRAISEDVMRPVHLAASVGSTGPLRNAKELVRARAMHDPAFKGKTAIHASEISAVRNYNCILAVDFKCAGRVRAEYMARSIPVDHASVLGDFLVQSAPA
jgi:hypothetical protein